MKKFTDSHGMTGEEKLRYTALGVLLMMVVFTGLNIVIAYGGAQAVTMVQAEIDAMRGSRAVNVRLLDARMARADDSIDDLRDEVRAELGQAEGRTVSSTNALREELDALKKKVEEEPRTELSLFPMYVVFKVTTGSTAEAVGRVVAGSVGAPVFRAPETQSHTSFVSRPTFLCHDHQHVWPSRRSPVGTPTRLVQD